MADKLAWFKFEPSSWRTDPDLRRCSLQARGVWIDILCIAFNCQERGVLATNGTAWSKREIAEAVGGDVSVVLHCIDELLRKGVARERPDGTIFSKRMTDDEQMRIQASEHGAKGGRPRKGCGNGKPNPPLSKNLTPLLSSLSLDSQTLDSSSLEERKFRKPSEPFEQTAEGLATAWCFFLQRTMNRGIKADDPKDVANVFREMLKTIPAPAMLVEIERDDRDKAEYVWEFKKRLQKQKAGTNGTKRQSLRYDPERDG